MADRARRILIVDDEAHILHVLLLKLRLAGYEVITATDGEEAFDVACGSASSSSGGVPPLDLIITDFQMPYMTGVELCRALSERPATAGIPILLLTARGYALDERDLALPNIRAVLSKPFSPRQIVHHVDSLLQSQSPGTADLVGRPGRAPRVGEREFPS